MNGKLDDIPDEAAPDDKEAIGAALGSGTSSVTTVIGLWSAVMLGIGYLFI
jgi:hypothetical protein